MGMPIAKANRAACLHYAPNYLAPKNRAERRDETALVRGSSKVSKVRQRDSSRLDIMGKCAFKGWLRRFGWRGKGLQGVGLQCARHPSESFDHGITGNKPL
jgi:hypothetical protein